MLWCILVKDEIRFPLQRVNSATRRIMGRRTLSSPPIANSSSSSTSPPPPGSIGAGSPMSSSADRTRQLAEQAPPSCLSSDAFPTTLLFLTDALTAFRAGGVAIRAFSARGKITTLTEKAGLIFRVSNSSAAARRVYENWRPLHFSPPRPRPQVRPQTWGEQDC